MLASQYSPGTVPQHEVVLVLAHTDCRARSHLAQLGQRKQQFPWPTSRLCYTGIAPAVQRAGVHPVGESFSVNFSASGWLLQREISVMLC